MEERKAIHYGQVELIPGVICDGYILDDGSCVMSERGTADLLGMYHKALQSVATNWPPKSLEPFVDKDLSVATNLVEVVAENSPHKGRKIIVYEAKIIENMIRGYALALASDMLRENQKHIGKRCVFLLSSLIRTALEAAIAESCGMVPQVQKLARASFLDCEKAIRKLGFKPAVDDSIAINQKRSWQRNSFFIFFSKVIVVIFQLYPVIHGCFLFVI